MESVGAFVCPASHTSPHFPLVDVLVTLYPRPRRHGGDNPCTSISGKGQEIDGRKEPGQLTTECSIVRDVDSVLGRGRRCQWKRSDSKMAQTTGEREVGCKTAKRECLYIFLEVSLRMK